ncbi:furcatin hydrolase isoform X2 [Coffea arabica]|uniref:Furcatin hydrolase isoform X2 n=1 Tax=Coffea arabica TaxID=13443 RepID=A0ABM4WIS4_COFAR
MAMQVTFLVALLLLPIHLLNARTVITSFNRSSFPDDFVFGASSAAYQYEGAAFEGGKGPSIWDTFTHKYPGKILNGSNGDVAEDFYHRYKDDVKLMKFIGLDAFRFSISWPRILPRGKLSGGVNKEGVAFYNNLINELISNGIKPFVTIFHWDVPQALEDEYHSFLSPLIVFIHPLIYGDYPASMHKLVKNRLPKFTPEQSKIIKGSFDFLGLNYYTEKYAINIASQNNINVSSSTDPLVNLTSERNGKFLGDPTGDSFFCAYPKGLRDLLEYTKKKYNNPTIYITENGIGDANNSTRIKSIKDFQRVDFYHRHLLAVQEAMKLGVNVKGFFAWSFLDDFEWSFGYTLRFGICYVDYEDGLKRYPKSSALWFKKFLRK